MATQIVLSVLALAIPIFAQDSRGICGWQQIRGGIVRDSLYLEGGLQQLGTWSGSKWDPCTVVKPDHGSLFKLNFSKSFDVRSTNLRNLFEQINETLDSSGPIYADGTMIADDDEFYTVGGLAYINVDSNPMHGEVHVGLYQPNAVATGFQPSINTMYSLPSNITQYITHGAGVSIPSENLGFYFSGLSSSNDSRIGYTNGGPGASDFPGQTVTTMMKVDTSSSNNAVFTQLDLPNNTARAGASMAWIPTGAQGVLVVVGGVIYPFDAFGYSLTSLQKAANTNQSPSFVSTVQVFDVASGTWYAQNTTGTSMPPPFAKACAVVASAADSSSHSIYVYGGWDDNGDTMNAYDDVWILSVPSFTWIKAVSGSTAHGRYAHTCAKPYPNQMFTIGGITGYGAAINNPNIIDVLDLNTLNWTGTYDPTKWSEYKVPAVVTAVIGGNADGGSTNVATSMNSNLRSVFSTKYSKTITKWYPYGTEPTPAAPKKSVAVPVAVSVVVVVIVLVTAVVAWFCFCSPKARKKRSQKSSEDSTHYSNKISRWINNSAQFPPPKSIISSDATEIGEPTSAPNPEMAGFSYFSPYARPHGVPAEVDSTPVQNAQRGVRATSPGSPGSHGSSELEAPAPPPAMSQILNGNNRNTDVFRSHPIYPPSVGNQSNSSANLSSRYANARAPSDTTSNAIELPQNRSKENLGLAAPREDLNRSKSEKSHTETSTDISAPTDTDGDLAEMPLPHSMRNAEQMSHQTRSTQQKSHPPTALSNITQSSTTHHRSTSSASSGMAITLSPTPSSAVRSVSPAEDERRSAHLESLPERMSQNQTNNRQSAYQANNARMDAGS